MKESLQTKAIQLEYINQQIKAMQAHLNEIMNAIDELNVLKVGLNNLKGAEKGDEILVPLGASSYVPAQILGAEKVVVSVGAGVFMEKKVKEAVSIVDNQVDELKKQEETVVNNMSLLGNESEKLTEALNKAIKASGNV